MYLSLKVSVLKLILKGQYHLQTAVKLLIMLIIICMFLEIANFYIYLREKMRIFGKPRVDQIKIPHWTKCNFSTIVWYFYTQISWFIWDRSCYNNFFKNYFTFLQSYGYINILCHIFNSAWNNQQRLVIFIHVIRWEGKIAFNSKQDQSEC